MLITKFEDLIGKTIFDKCQLSSGVALRFQGGTIAILCGWDGHDGNGTIDFRINLDDTDVYELYQNDFVTEEYYVNFIRTLFEAKLAKVNK